MKTIKLTVLFLVCGFLAACGLFQRTPQTKAFQTQAPVLKNSEGMDVAATGIVVGSGTIIIDGRPPAEYLFSHIQGSLSMRWEDFSQSKQPHQGLLDPDLFFHARRLARYGISPESSVIVVGRGRSGDGEEGRLAWTLRVLGLKQVQFAHIDQFSIPLSTQDSPPLPPVPMWKPEIDESLRVSKKEFLAKLATDRRDLVLIDVRSERDYLGKEGTMISRKAPDLGAINIPWTEFITKTGLPDSTIKARLEEVGITPQKQVLVIDQKGVRSALVTLVLRELGYKSAANFAGGYQELIHAGN